MESFHAPTITYPSRTVPISYYGFVNTELDLNYQYTTTRNPRNLLGVIRSGSAKHHPLLSFTESPTSLDPLKRKGRKRPEDAVRAHRTQCGAMIYKAVVGLDGHPAFLPLRVPSPPLFPSPLPLLLLCFASKTDSTYKSCRRRRIVGLDFGFGGTYLISSSSFAVCIPGNVGSTDRVFLFPFHFPHSVWKLSLEG
ncbi:hypothetical protein BHM03_00037992 [Ensete ventricosum]|nr:hypothetical protein BHM03_00037992 [Ensete ventricosum]